jgi:hypothetical protein
MALVFRTDRDVVVFSLRHLNVIAGDDEGEGFEIENALAVWHALHAELAMDQLVEFPADEIPSEAFRSCFQLLADAIAPAKGRQPFAPAEDDMHPSRVLFRKRLAMPDDGEIREISEF